MNIGRVRDKKNNDYYCHIPRLFFFFLQNLIFWFSFFI